MLGGSSGEDIWVENRLVGSVPLVAATMREREQLVHEPIVFDPRCASARWVMLSTFPRVEGDTLVWPDVPPVESEQAYCRAHETPAVGPRVL